MAEDIVVKTLENAGASCTLVSEECGFKRIGDVVENDYVILDGIDGTANAVHGFPFSSTSLAFADGPRLKDVRVGLIMDLYRGVIFYAEAGKGSFRDGVKLKTSSVSKMNGALVGFELSYLREREKGIKSLIPLLARSGKIRLLGSTALEVCYVASGYLDAFVDVRNVVRATDIAAAQFILEEAGGLNVTPVGHPLDIELTAYSKSSFVAASNQPLCRKILRLLDTTLSSH